ncbi:MAG: arylsulfotransferase family protein [Planctomycetota bacterium]
MLRGRARLRRLARALRVARPFALLLAASCGGEGDVVSEPPLAAREPDLEALRAIGYADLGGRPEPAEAAGASPAEPALVAPGLNVYADEVDRVLALDADGRTVHAWRIPGRSQVEHALPLGGGRLLAVSVDQGVTAVDADSRVLWSRDLNAHHDVARAANGTFLVPVWKEREYRGRRVRFDQLVRLDPSGERLGAWDTFEHLDELQRLHPPLALDRAAPPAAGDDAIYDYYHLNTVAPVPPNALGDDARFRAGNLVLCFRNANLIVILERDTHELVWSYRPGTLDMPHTPRVLPTGTLLIFDNGRHRGWSRVIEVDPRDGRTVWSWQADPRPDFFSDVRGSCQRLSNGNTLICESERGRAFEVAPAGDVVWELVNPLERGGRPRRMYRFLRYSEAELFGPR